MCTYAYYSIFHSSLSLSLFILLPSFISFIKNNSLVPFSLSLANFPFLFVLENLLVPSRVLVLRAYGPAPQNVITASRSAFVRFPPFSSFFLHFLLIFFFFFFCFLTVSSSTYSYLEQESRGLSCPWIVSSAQGIPFVLSSLEPAFSFSLPFPFSRTASMGNRALTRSNDRFGIARGFAISIVRAGGRRDERREGRGFRLRSFPLSFFFFFFPLPRLVCSRLRSSFFFFFWARVRDSFAFDPWRFVLRARGPLDPRSTEKEIEN